MDAEQGLEQATIGGGCFWCIEAVFESLEGVRSVVSGYAGGVTKNPTYEEVCSGATGHAEVAQITFDPGTITYEELLEVFWNAHDPTTMNRQGVDVGTQYRSVIFYHDERQQAIAIESKLSAAGRFADKIVTEIRPLERFYEAEHDHQDYFRNNPTAPYCMFVIRPKLEKVSRTRH